MGRFGVEEWLRARASNFEEFAEWWLDSGGSSWEVGDDGVPYFARIQDPEARAYWERERSYASLIVDLGCKWTTYVCIFGGFALAAAMVRLKAKGSSYAHVDQGDAFQEGAKLLAGKVYPPPWASIKWAYRHVEVLGNICLLFGGGMLVVWWPYFLPLWLLLFILPGLSSWQWTLMDAPVLAVAATTRRQVLGATVRWMVFLLLTLLAMPPLPGKVQVRLLLNPLLETTLKSKILFLDSHTLAMRVLFMTFLGVHGVASLYICITVFHLLWSCYSGAAGG